MPVVLIDDHDHGRTYLRCACGAVFVLDDEPAEQTPVVCHVHDRLEMRQNRAHAE